MIRQITYLQNSFNGSLKSNDWINRMNNEKEKLITGSWILQEVRKIIIGNIYIKFHRNTDSFGIGKKEEFITAGAFRHGTKFVFTTVGMH